MLNRPTLLGLMALIAYFAVGPAAVRSNNGYRAVAFLILTVFGFCTATLSAIHRRGAWAGFAVFGWAWFLICQPHAGVPPSGSLSMVVLDVLAPYFAEAYSPWSVSSGLSLSCVAVGLLGALVGWLIGRESETWRRS